MKPNDTYRIFFFLIALMAIPFFLQSSPIEDDYYDSDIDTKVFEKENWEKAIEGLDYSPNQVKKKEEETPQSQGSTNTRTRRNRNYTGWDFNVGNVTWSGVFKFVLILLLIVGISAVLFRVMGGSIQLSDGGKTPDTRDFTSEVNIEKIEEELQKSDMEILLDRTIAKEDFMKAVRLYYLWAIKELSERRLIKWKRDKTNRDYIREMRKSDLAKPFREVTRIFERVWYGDQEQLSKTDFQQLEPKFKSFVDTVKRR